MRDGCPRVLRILEPWGWDCFKVVEGAGCFGVGARRLSKSTSREVDRGTTTLFRSEWGMFQIGVSQADPPGVKEKKKRLSVPGNLRLPQVDVTSIDPVP
jgi:hypothetical protein